MLSVCRPVNLARAQIELYVAVCNSLSPKPVKQMSHCQTQLAAINAQNNVTAALVCSDFSRLRLTQRKLSDSRLSLLRVAKSEECSNWFLIALGLHQECPDVQTFL